MCQSVNNCLHYLSESYLSVCVSEHQAGLCQGVQVGGQHTRGTELVRGLQHTDVGSIGYLYYDLVVVIRST